MTKKMERVIEAAFRRLPTDSRQPRVFRQDVGGHPLAAIRFANDERLSVRVVNGKIQCQASPNLATAVMSISSVLSGVSAQPGVTGDDVITVVETTIQTGQPTGLRDFAACLEAIFPDQVAA